MNILEWFSPDVFRAVAMWASAVAGVAFILALIWRTDKRVAEFRIVDLVLEGEPPKASVSKLILLVFAGLSVWVVVLSVLDNKIDPAVSSLLLGVLGIFVLGRAAQQGINQLANRSHYEQRFRDTEVDIEIDRQAATARPIPRPKRDSVIR